MSLSTLLLLVLVMMLVGAVVVAVGAYQANARRAIALARAGGVAATSTDAIPLITLPDDSSSVAMRMGKVAERWLPEGAVSLDTSSQLIQAGFESPAAPVLYTMTRLVSALIIPGALFAWGPHDSSFMVLLSGAIGIALGLVAPPALLERMRRLRQERIIRSIPDTLDLLLVCVEAGVSLDAALLRVGREMVLLHPELANELLTMNRRMNAGMRREEALHGLFERTGVDELRSLGSNMIQSERWGTSIAKVLRVYSESLRRKRRQAAEKKAAVAATKMVFPLALFILPALFAVIGGPAVIAIGPVFAGDGPVRSGAIMQRLEMKLSNRKGFTLILSALMIFVFIGAAVMAVDVGHMQMRRADVHAASDAAALAGIEKYRGYDDAAAALAEAQAVRRKVQSGHARRSRLLPADFSPRQLGRATGTFTRPVDADRTPRRRPFATPVTSRSLRRCSGTFPQHIARPHVGRRRHAEQVGDQVDLRRARGALVPATCTRSSDFRRASTTR